MKALKHLGSFAGDEDVEWWLGCFEVALQIDKKQEEEVDMLIMRLVGPAYDMWHGLPASQLGDAKCIKAALRQVFGRSWFEVWAAMAGDSALLEEMLSMFGEWLHSQAAVAGSDPVDMVCALFMLGMLLADIQDKVVLQLGENITKQPS